MQAVVADIIQRFSTNMGREFLHRPKMVYLGDSLEHSDLFTLYDMADVVVHPSRSEGWGLGVAESMARGKAVVLSDYGASNEFTPDHVTYKYPAFRCVRASAPSCMSLPPFVLRSRQCRSQAKALSVALGANAPVESPVSGL
jgi:hypothetical protein